MTNRRLQLFLLAAFCLSWPILVDQGALGDWLSPSNDSNGQLLAFALKVVSLIAGGLIAASILLVDKKLKTWQLWTSRVILATLISGGLFIVKVIADFSRDF